MEQTKVSAGESSAARNRLCWIDVIRDPVGVGRRIATAYDVAQANWTAVLVSLGISRSCLASWIAKIREADHGFDGDLAHIRAKHAAAVALRAAAAGRKGGLVGHGGRPRKAKNTRKKRA